MYRDIKNSYSECNLEFMRFPLEEIEKTLVDVKNLYKKVDPKFENNEITSEILLSLFGWTLRN